MSSGRPAMVRRWVATLACALWASLAGAAAPLLPGLGAYHWPTGSPSAAAQRYFDQGVVLVYGFNPQEAARSFEAAVAADPRCGLCWWGLAWSLGPNINSDMAPEARARVDEALRRAQGPGVRATAVQRALVEALAARHPRGAAIDEEAYEHRMQALARRFPDDANVATLAAEARLNLHPYDWWADDGSPRAWTPETVALLERAQRASPAHPGALHYWIHLHELSTHPERAVGAADRLREAFPGSGHLTHMPAHVYLRVGRYEDAVLASERAIAADARYLQAVDAQGAYRVGYVAHNHHFLWASAAMQGRATLAIQAARDAWPAACGPRGRDLSTAIVQHYYALPLFALVRFGRWETILRDTLPPDVNAPYPNAMWHYARGTALARTGRLEEARAELARLQALQADPGLEALQLKNLNAASRLVEIAALTLQADIALAARRPAQAVALLERATRIEDGLEYDEPHLWLAPTRHALGAALLAADRPADADRVYREDLAHYPKNGWSLTGLAQAQRALGRTREAQATERRAREAFARAEVAPPASRF